MAEITIKNIEDEKVWEGFLDAHPEANFLQSWHWGEFHKALGSAIHRVGFYNGNDLTGVMLSVVEDAKRGRYLTVPAGPIMDWHSEDLVKAFMGEIKKQAKDGNCVFVRVRPQLESGDFSKALFKKYGFVSAPIHLHAELTSQLDLTPTQDQLLANMRKATRYEIKKGITQGIKITTSQNPEDIKKFYNLQIATSERQKFVPFSYKFFHEQFKVFALAGKALLYSAEIDGQLLAQGFIIFYGKEAAYHYGASTDEGRKYPGAYLIQWEAIKEAKRRGMQRYNFWGVTHEDQKDHRFYRLSIFKRGFGGADLEYLHAQDLVINKLKYLVNWAVENIRKKVRHV
jgi:lipid II:glycine glycyltransferase (peptidoglycan interpeptide bridge formation enzyme)